MTAGAPVGARGAAAEKPGGIHQGPTSYGDPGFSRFVRSVFLASAGYDDADTDRPIIGVGHSISDFTPCHRDMGALLDAVCRGVLEAGGLPMAFPTTSLGEVFLDPTSMMFRNLLALEVEELVRAQPMDAAVLLGGCDKTVPGQLMGAISAGRPVLEVVAGPMIAGRWQGQRIGACTDCRRLWAGHRAGEVSDAEVRAAADVLAPTGGTCMVMGTASTMAILAEVLGLAVAGSATAPAPSGDRLRAAVRSGRRSVEMAAEGLTPQRVLTRSSFVNAAAGAWRGGRLHQRRGAPAGIGGARRRRPDTGRAGIRRRFGSGDRRLQTHRCRLPRRPARRRGSAGAARRTGTQAGPGRGHRCRLLARRIVGGRRRLAALAVRAAPPRRPGQCRAEPRGAVRIAGTRRRGAQSGCGDPGAADPPRPGGDLRRNRRPAGAHRRGQRNPRLGAGAARLRPGRQQECPRRAPSPYPRSWPPPA